MEEKRQFSEKDLGPCGHPLSHAGDTIEVGEDRGYRNGRLLVEPYADYDGRDDRGPRWSTDPVAVPEGHMFVLGDRRHRSFDSRYTGCVRVNSILGYPRMVFWSREPDKNTRPATATGPVRWARIGTRFDNH